MRLYDTPNDSHYGPARRGWVILMGMIPDMELLDRHYFWEWGSTWDADLKAQLLKDSNEFLVMRTIIMRCLDCYPD